ncbi:MAG: LptA/OstA family protein [Alphaproteobacteria bacterium]|jgi:lipopolysaccharide export system protein LptA|nr:LptA/OstA family protein [Alphaproteobacteria bacterium]
MTYGIIRIMSSLCFLSPAFATPQTPSSPPVSTNQANIKIISDEMDCNQTTNVCIAKGNAIAEKLGDSKVKILKADQITAYFAKDGENGPMKVVRLEADGNVFFIIGDIIVQGKRGHYATEEETAEVFEDVKITNGENQLEGGYGKVHMKTGQYTIRNTDNRVQALIFTKDKNREPMGNTKINDNQGGTPCPKP